MPVRKMWCVKQVPTQLPNGSLTGLSLSHLPRRRVPPADQRLRHGHVVVDGKSFLVRVARPRAVPAAAQLAAATHVGVGHHPAAPQQREELRGIPATINC
jgi:hypothetical protein